MQNVQLKSDGKTLTITVDLTQRIGPSRTGKTVLVATTGGNADVPNAPGVKVGVNVYESRAAA